MWSDVYYPVLAAIIILLITWLSKVISKAISKAIDNKFTIPLQDLKGTIEEVRGEFKESHLELKTSYIIADKKQEIVVSYLVDHLTENSFQEIYHEKMEAFIKELSMQKLLKEK